MAGEPRLQVESFDRSPPSCCTELLSATHCVEDSFSQLLGSRGMVAFPVVPRRDADAGVADEFGDAAAR
jgi:hypothetical protein